MKGHKLGHHKSPNKKPGTEKGEPAGLDSNPTAMKRGGRSEHQAEGHKGFEHLGKMKRGGRAAGGAVAAAKHPVTEAGSESGPAGIEKDKDSVDKEDDSTGGRVPLKTGGSIHIKPSHKGLLHKDLGVAAGSPIPASKLAKAEHSSDPAEKKRAVFAENAQHWHH